MNDGTVISIDEIISMSGEIFETIVIHSCDELIAINMKL